MALFRINVSVSYDEDFLVIADNKDEAEELIRNYHNPKDNDYDDPLEPEFSTKLVNQEYLDKHGKYFDIDIIPLTLEDEESEYTIAGYLQCQKIEEHEKKIKEAFEKNNIPLFEKY